MRIGMVSTLCVFPLICAPRPAAAQLNPASPQPPHTFLWKLPTPARLSEFSRAAESNGARFRTEHPNEPFLLVVAGLAETHQVGAGAMGIQSPVETSRCAHILIYPAPIVDSKMIIKAPKEFPSNMPTFEGLQPCWRDFRGAIVTPQGSPFVGPGPIGAFARSPGTLLYEFRH